MADPASNPIGSAPEAAAQQAASGKRLTIQELFHEKILVSYTCSDCGQSFNQEEEACVHLMTFHNYGITLDAVADGIEDESTIAARQLEALQRARRDARSGGSVKLEQSEEMENARARDVVWVERKNLSTGTVSKVPRCKLCNKEFTTKQAIDYHMDTRHLKFKPYQCHQCGDTFAREFILKSHVARVHSGVKPFSCDVCSSSFSRKRELNAHLRDAHSDLTNACQLCGRSFDNRLSLHFHMKKIHGHMYEASTAEEPR